MENKNYYEYVAQVLDDPIRLGFTQIYVINKLDIDALKQVVKKIYSAGVLEHSEFLELLEFLTSSEIPEELKDTLLYKSSILGLSNTNYGEEKNILLDYVIEYLMKHEEISTNLEHKNALLRLFKNLMDTQFERDIELISNILHKIPLTSIFDYDESFSLLVKYIERLTASIPPVLRYKYQDPVMYVFLFAFTHYPVSVFYGADGKLNKTAKEMLRIAEEYTKDNPFEEFKQHWQSFYDKFKNKLETGIDAVPPSQTGNQQGRTAVFGASGPESMVKFIDPKTIKEGFDSLIGIEKVKEELNDIINYFKNPEDYKKHKVKMPKGMILYGNPGTGKTAIARALAKEAEVPFFYMSASEFIEMYVGVGAKRVRELFAEAKKKTPSIIYIDEIDAIGSREDNDNSERRSTINQILTEMDGFKENEDIFVIGSTNFIYNLDKALLRSGRFDKKIKISLPDRTARIKLFNRFIDEYKDTPIEIIRTGYTKEEYDEMVFEFAKESAGLSPADIRRLVDDVVRLSYRDLKTTKLDKDYFTKAFKQLFEGYSFDNPSSIKEIYGKDIEVSLKDLVGMESVKDEVKDVLKYFANPESFDLYGIKPPKGVIFYGEPGTGKTAIAKAIAKEAGVPFFYISASEIKDKWVGESSKKVKELFARAREKSPALIFIDEIDNLGSRSDGGNSVDSDVINQFLTELDGFKAKDGVVVIAATNFLEKLDPALIRKGRFDKKIKIPLPDKVTRKLIFLKYLNYYIEKGAKVEGDLEDILSRIVEKTTYYSPADIEGLVKDSIFESYNKFETPIISENFLDNAWRKSEIGVANNYKLKEHEKYDTAVHEAGHAIVSRYYGRPVNEISIIATSNALGYMLDLEKESRSEFSSSQSEIREDIDISMGGRIAEQLILNKITTGISGDMNSVKKRIEAMMNTYMFFGPFLEEKGKMKIMKQEFEDSETRTKNIILNHKGFLDSLVKKLLECERINQIEFESLWNQHVIKEGDLGIGTKKKKKVAN